MAKAFIPRLKNRIKNKIRSTVISSVNPQPPLPKEAKQALRDAEELRAKFQLVPALQLLEAMVNKYPACAQLYVSLSVTYFALRMDRKAQQMLSKAILCNPGDPEPARRLASYIIKKSKTPIRDSIGDVMRFVCELGFKPATIIDVGVNTGTPGLLEFSPDSKIIMIDPIAESETFMQNIAARFKDAHYELAAATSKEGSVTMSVYPSFGGSSVVEVVGRQNQGVDRVVPAYRVDTLARKHRCSGPYVIKVDVEGGEMDVLAGATGILQETELLILETRIRPFANAPQYLAVIDQLREYGFVPYDFIDRNYHDGDGSLKQFDLVAVKLNGFFRNEAEYTPFKEFTKDMQEDIIAGKLKQRKHLEEKLKIAS